MTTGQRKKCGADTKIGKNLRTLRKEKNLSISQMSTAMGISWQQLQKYETGTNRLSLSMAYRATLALDVELTRLLKGVKIRDLIL